MNQGPGNGKRRVIESIEIASGERCVDLFVREDGSWGFEEFRRDPEDGGRWQSLQRYGGLIFDSEAAARVEAKRQVAWLE